MMTPRTTSIHFLYDNPIGRFLMNEEGPSIWTCCRNPYKKGLITSAIDDPDLDSDPLRASYVRSIPKCKLYKGLLLQGYLISPKFMKSLSSFKIRSDDLFICSYPRSGTTWTEEIVSCIFSHYDLTFIKKPVHERVVHLEVGRPFGQKKYLDSLKSPRLLGTHLPLSHCPEELKEVKCKIIYVARNPKDQAVSYFHFHHTASYLGKEKRDWNTFLNLFLEGHLVYGSWFDHVRDWYLLSIEYPDKILFITYEELQVNLRQKVLEIADFIDVKLDSDLVDKIVDHCRFGQMKDNGAVNREEVPVRDLFVKSQFMRKGVIGDWKNHFSEEQSNQLDEVYSRLMKGTNLQFSYNQEEAINRMLTTVPLPRRRREEDGESSSSGTITPTSFKLSSNMTLQSNGSLERIETPLRIDRFARRPILGKHNYSFEIDDKYDKNDEGQVVIFDRCLAYQTSL